MPATGELRVRGSALHAHPFDRKVTEQRHDQGGKFAIAGGHWVVLRSLDALTYEQRADLVEDIATPTAHDLPWLGRVLRLLCTAWSWRLPLQPNPADSLQRMLATDVDALRAEMVLAAEGYDAGLLAQKYGQGKAYGTAAAPAPDPATLLARAVIRGTPTDRALLLQRAPASHSDGTPEGLHRWAARHLAIRGALLVAFAAKSDTPQLPPHPVDEQAAVAFASELAGPDIAALEARLARLEARGHLRPAAGSGAPIRAARSTTPNPQAAGQAASNLRAAAEQLEQQAAAVEDPILARGYRARAAEQHAAADRIAPHHPGADPAPPWQPPHLTSVLP